MESKDGKLEEGYRVYNLSEIEGIAIGLALLRNPSLREEDLDIKVIDDGLSFIDSIRENASSYKGIVFLDLLSAYELNAYRELLDRVNNIRSN